MLERQTRSFDDLLQDHDLVSLEHKQTPRRSESGTTCREPSPKQTLDDPHTMTRKTRTRRPRIAVIQSGYCAVCNLPYNNVEDHIQSKKHQKLIGEDANYIALNGSLNGFLDGNGIPFLNLNGIEAIGVHDSSLEDFSSPKYRRRNMSKARSIRETSVAPDKTKSSADSDTAGHHLRSRRNINYMTPPSEDDSFLETPDLILSEPIRREFKEYRELRSSTRALAKLTEQVQESPQEELWNSGRPKRTCLKRKRLSLDDRPPRTYYKVEMVNPKSRNCQKEKEINYRRQQSPKHEDDKGLIVKFKKMRNSELVQLNNEATNFLFPKKEVTNEEEEFKDEIKKTESDKANQNTSSVLSEDSNDSKRFKYEDDASMDSSCSNGKKRKRRTHAEAFIMDNQKYYKFETPGSRLRYQGSYLPSLVKSAKSNGQCPPNTASGGVIKMEEPEEKKVKKVPVLELDKYSFSFETVPDNAPWYQAFQRLDRGEQRYLELPDHFNDEFILPYQMSRITPLDPQLCIQAYNQVLKFFQNTVTTPEADTSPDCAESDSRESLMNIYESALDEDSKLSAASSSFSTDKEKKVDGGKNPRKSPRQHASTLAILSSLIQQRRRRSKGRLSETLPTITEECMEDAGKDKAKVDYVILAQTIEDELDMALDDELEEHIPFDDEQDDPIDFHNSKTTVAEIMKLFEEEKAKETDKSCRRFFNGSPGRKPGRKRKKNLTGWPSSKQRKGSKACRVKDNNSSSDSSVNNDSDTEEMNSTDSFKQCTDSFTNNNRVNRNKVLTNKVTNEVMQPFIYVQKLDNKEGEKKSPKKMQRRVPASPRSPRVLRKPRGRWYRER